VYVVRIAFVCNFHELYLYLCFILVVFYIILYFILYFYIVYHCNQPMATRSQ